MSTEPFPLNRRVLIVDDTAAIHADFHKLLGANPAADNELAAAAAAFLGTTAPLAEARETFELTSAYQGEEALKLVQESLSQGRPFALVFMDVRMPPGWNGIETTARLWQLDPDLQVVLCTAYSDYSWEEIVAQLGTSDRLLILKKPFDRMEVLQLAKTLSEKWRLTHQWNRRMEDLDRLVEQRTQELRVANQNLQVQIGERERTQGRLSAFAALAQRLNATRTVKAAGQLIVEVADQLLGWDACLLDLYSPAQDILSQVLNADLVNGQRTEVTLDCEHRPPTPLARRVMQQGGQLILREPAAPMPEDATPFGDRARPSVSLLFVPIRDGRSVIGLLSIQSYTPHAYNEQSLATLQALADYCGGALNRIRTEESLRYRQKMENLISSLSTTFINLSPAETDAAVTNALKIIGTFLGTDFCGIASLAPKAGQPQHTHLWCAEGLPAFSLHPQSAPSWEALPWWMEKLRALETIVLPKLTALPPEAAAEQAFLNALKVRSLLAVPLARGGALLGFLALGAVHREFPWSAEVIALLKMLGEIVANALEHKRTSERVALQSAALEAAANSIVLTDPQGTILWQNPAFARLTGYAPAETLGKKINLLKSGQQQPAFYQQLWATITAGQVWRGEITNRRQDGSLYTEDMTITPVRDANGQIAHFIAIKQDVTERKRAEQRIAAFSNLGQRLSVAQTAKQAAQIIVEAADQLLGWDACLCELYSPADCTLRHVLGIDLVEGQRTEWIPTTFDGPPTALAKRAMEQGGQLVLRDEPKQMRVDGVPFGDQTRPSASLLFVPIRHGAQVIGVLSIQSYTPKAYNQHSLETLQALADHCGGALERIRAQEARNQSQERLNAFFTGATAGLALVDKDLRYLQINETLAEMNGVPLSQHLGRTVREVLPQLAGTLEPIVQQVFATGKPALNLEFIGQTANKPGVQRHWVASYFPITGQDNRPEAVGTMVLEVTERKHLEAQLRQAQKMEAIGQLAGGVAHDFNNLLAVIRGNAELLAMDADQFQAEHREFLEQIVAASERAANLTRQLLAFSRKQVMQPQPLNLNEVLGNLSKMLKRIIGEDIDLQCQYAAQAPRVFADVGMLEQAVMNLVINARDAMPQGGHLQLGTETLLFAETPHPAHPQARAGEFVCLTVRDTGSGIAPEHLARVFEPFFTTKQPGKGTGLGLATVYGIVQQHQGWVEVTSHLGAGSTFKLFLPALKVAVAEQAKMLEGPPPRGGSETILLVEDDEAVRSLTRRVLQSSGYQVREAVSGRAALNLWTQQGAQFDLLLTDMIMPEGVSGRELAEQLLAQKPGLKVLFMSGYSGDAVVQDPTFLQRTHSQFLQKPCSARTLLQAVRQRLDEH
jgi:PAS domain S-box-containing protein